VTSPFSSLRNELFPPDREQISDPVVVVLMAFAVPVLKGVASCPKRFKFPSILFFLSEVRIIIVLF